MVRARIKKVSKNEDTFSTDLNQINFISSIPELNKSLVLFSGKLNRDVTLSRIRWMALAESKNRLKYIIKTYNSTYIVTILREDIL